ncbi:MAG: ABC transporter permease, partial [Oscillospiraceae bacterium]|nr:ABC transporter permease [Oscillospiraceae bacterium]
MKPKYFAIPYVGWMALFIVIPLALIVVYAFSNGAGSFTLDNFSNMLTYSGVFGRSFLLAFIATVICILIGYPVAYAIAHENPRIQRTLMLLIMLPMWMNFLLRTYSWMSLLENTGLINKLLNLLGLPAAHMINTPGAVVLGMVYNFLPFMILPIYT